ncbi:unnamed protein product, partial [Polarella glacialis]
VASLRELLDRLDPAQATSLLSSLDSASAEEVGGGEAAASLRRLWRCYPQRAIVAKWSSHLQSTLKAILAGVCAFPGVAQQLGQNDSTSSSKKNNNSNNNSDNNNNNNNNSHNNSSNDDNNKDNNNSDDKNNDSDNN